jgi:hypothetical protein
MLEILILLAALLALVALLLYANARSISGISSASSAASTSNADEDTSVGLAFLRCCVAGEELTLLVLNDLIYGFISSDGHYYLYKPVRYKYEDGELEIIR